MGFLQDLFINEAKAVLPKGGGGGIDPDILAQGGIGYIDAEKTILDVVLFPHEDGYTMHNGQISMLSLVEGRTYTVITDSGEYTAVCKKFSALPIEFLYIGNAGIMGLADTGETFVYCEAIENGVPNCLFADFANGTKAVVKAAETIHSIDPKFLPEGGIGYIDAEGETILDVTLDPYDDGTSQYMAPIAKHQLIVGETYTVITDSGEFTAVCKEATVGEDVWPYIGNVGLFGFPDSGESFLYGEAVQNGILGGMFVDFKSGSKAVVKITNVVRRIDPKFLPKGGFGYEEDALTWTSDGNVEGKAIYNDEYNNEYIHISDEIYNLKDVTAVAYSMGDSGVTYLPLSEMEYVEENGITRLQYTTGDIVTVYTFPIALTLTEDKAAAAGVPAGTYVYHPSSIEYILGPDRIEFAPKVHKIDPKFLPEGSGGSALKIDLADYGVDVFGLFVAGGGTAPLTNYDALWELVNASDVPVTLIVQNSSAGLRVETPMTKTMSGDEFNGLTANIPIYYNSTHVLQLYVTGSHVILNIGTSQNGGDVATKEYVDQLILGAIGGSY